MNSNAPSSSRKKTSRNRTSTFRIAFVSSLTLVFALLATSIAYMAPPLPGAIFTTNSTCGGTNVNIFSAKPDVYLNGGPTHPNAASLPDGAYYVRVTNPSGSLLLGTSVNRTAPNDKPFVVINGAVACLQLSTILDKASDNTPGYDSTDNPGGEYKVWVSTDSTFTNNTTKTDNFKVKEEGPVIPPQGELSVTKFYDADTDGQLDPGELPIDGWKIFIADGINYIRFTPVDLFVDPDTYSVVEGTPVETNWIATGNCVLNNLTLATTCSTSPAQSAAVNIADGDKKTVQFANVCLGPGGGLTLGFWSNKNGEKLYSVGGDNALMVSLNLRNANGTNFDPTNHNTFKSWILSANATNMANMLSAQLAAMELNVLNGNVNGGALVYAPGATSANGAGFATVNALMNEANTELGLHGLVLSGNAFRNYQEALKNALDNANNNLNFVQSAPCSFSFSE